ncbi:MAG: ATP-binding protein, partial [Bacteroidota bacterium]
FEAIHGVVGELIYAKNFYVALYDPVNNQISFPYFADEVDPPPPPRAFSHGSTEYILETGNILHAPQTVFDTLSEQGVVNLIGSPAVDWLGVPLQWRDKTFGVLAIQSYDPKILFGDREKEILVFVSQHIASIIQQKLEEERFRAIWEHATDGMRVSNKDGTIVMVNDAYCRLVKKKKEELIGQSINIVYDPEIMEAQKGEHLYRERFTESTVIPRSDSQLFLWNQETPFVEIDSLYLQFGINERMLLSIFRDITERKKLEDQLLHAQKMDSIGVLAGGIAHDFNNVLAMILGSAELLKMKTKDHPEIGKFAQMIVTAAERGSSIAKQLLMFARTEKGIHRPVSLSRVVRDVSLLLEHSIPKSITISTNIFSTNDTMLGDEDQLHQVILNLAVNARDAIEQRGISDGRLTFSIKNREPESLRKQFPQVSDSSYVELEVSDNGNGMTEQTIQRVFEPFFSTKMRGKGTGLGLSIVHGIIKNHNGLVEVKSIVGTGTTFLIYFPAIQPIKPEAKG